jgi:exodeoxyribonuclease V alpha subunit
MKRLSLLVESGELEPIDAELGGLLARRAAASLGTVGEVRYVGLAGAVLSAERARGHSCLDLQALVGVVAPWNDVIGPLLPDVESWRSLLARSGICGDGGSPSPLVMDGARLYLYRYHAAECRLAESIRSRIGQARDDAAPDAGTVALFRQLFAVKPGAPTDLQAVAAAATMRGRLTVITGGPGTGKTTTVAKILALLLHREPELRIALAAPTGKAAARLAESIRGGVAELPLDDALRARIPADGKTLHRLLGYRPWNDEFTHGPSSPLGEDVIIVDEASMVDVLMMDALFAALRPSARVILLGDRDQLASVDTGYVLGDLCQAADGCGVVHGERLAQWYEALSGQEIESSGAATPLRDAVVRLIRSYRFESQPGVGELAESIRTGNANGALAVLADASRPDVSRRDPVRSVTELLAPIASLIDDYLAAGNPEVALDRFAAFRVLCALRDGNTGVEGLNERIEAWLRTRGVPTRARWYNGKPVLVTANDHATGLFNGDVGVTVIEGGQPRIWFRDGAGKARAVAPARLPAHVTAWAMTVHKSQGSEFAHVLLVLPEEDTRVLTRELLYTGVTRARTKVDIVGQPELIQRAVGRTTIRASGLADRLTS